MKLFKKTALVAVTLVGILLLPIVVEIGINPQKGGNGGDSLISSAYAEGYTYHYEWHSYNHWNRWKRWQNNYSYYNNRYNYNNYNNNNDQYDYRGGGNYEPWPPAYDY